MNPIKYESPQFKNIVGRNLMIFSFPCEADIICYQAEMISNNDIKGLLRADYTKINSQSCLQYDVTSLIPLTKLFERKKLLKAEFILIIKQIAELLDTIEHYLLEGGGIVFDSNYIFVDPQDLKLSFTYIPSLGMSNNLEYLKRFLLNLIIEDISFADEPSDNYMRKFIELVKLGDFDKFSLKRYISEEGLKQPQIQKEDNVPKSHINQVINKEIRLPKGPSIEKENKNNKPPVLTGTKKLCYPIKCYAILFSVIGVLFIFGVSLIITGVLSPINPDFLLSLFGFLMIGGAITYLVYSKLFTFDKKVERLVKPSRVNVEKPSRCEYVNKAFKVPPPIPNFQQTRPQMQKPHNPPSVFINKEKKEIIPIDGTVLLNSKTLNEPHLIRTAGKSAETIFLNRIPFMLGRLENQVDYFISNPAVGKLHAEITNGSEGFLITDMNSKNGTFINGERIQSGSGNLIKHEDRITLGNEEFVFYCSL